MEPALLSRLPATRRRNAGRTRLCVLLFVLMLASCRPVAADPAVSFWEDRRQEELIGALLERMSDAELLGQVFMVGYIGKDPSPELLDWIRNRNLGGVKIFTRNVDTLAGLARAIGRMQGEAQASRIRIPLFISTDQEGGWVRHIKAETSQTPGNIALGAAGLPRDAFLTGYYIGEELRSLGINMNFAPTIDIYSNPSASVIGPRSFSSDPLTTSLLALAYFKGMARSGVISTAKHYPGHGNADRDSHGSLPVVRLSLHELWDRELLPYRILISEGLPAVMSGHLAYPEILGDLTPSSRSTFLIKEVLRAKMGFDGLVVTDDMEMSGVLGGGLDTPQASLEALNAGNDMILVSHTPGVQEKTWQRLLEKLQRDPSLRERLKSSVRRVLRLKLKTFRQESFPVYPEQRKGNGSVPAPGASEFFEESAMRSVTLLRGKLVPFTPAPGEKILLISQFEEFLIEGKRRYPQADTLLFPYSPFYSARPEDLARIPQRASGYETVIFCLANYNSLEVLKGLKQRAGRVVVISALSPVYLREVPWVESCLAVYGTGSVSFRAGFAALAGDFRPEGKLPIQLFR